VRVGLAGCDMGACAMLPRIIGQGRASELLYTGRSMSAEEGLAWGFFNRVGNAMELSMEMAQELAAGPTGAHAVTKKMLHMEKKDFLRAYEAFAARRKPEFQGD
jgi:enoyl-CoA hydratase/carnithine racemase